MITFIFASATKDTAPACAPPLGAFTSLLITSMYSTVASGRYLPSMRMVDWSTTTTTEAPFSILKLPVAPLN